MPAGRLLWLIFLLIPLGLRASGLPPDSLPPDNVELFQRLAGQYLDTAAAFRLVSGFGLSALLSPPPADTNASLRLQLSSPVVVYEKLKKKQYRRALTLVIIRRDSLARADTLHYADTLENRNLQRLLREGPDELRGEDPRFVGKWLKPIALITLSIGLILGLFYLRSS